MASTHNALAPSAAFSGAITPTRTSLLYRLGLAVVAFAMVLLPLIYIALILFMAKLVWWHLSRDVSIFQYTDGRALIIAALLYLGPAIAGMIFVAFLIKPLFSRRTKSGPTYIVAETDEPELFAFVRKICELVGAPQPRALSLDCRVNASAGFRRGWWSFFCNDLILTIGLPLIAGMTTRQVAGALAHELGHFAQGAGMRLSFVIRTVNAWFARTVYERDYWDEWLAQWAANDDWRIQSIFKLAQLGVWVGRQVLWLLMHVGHALSCFMSRQMEFDADSYQAKLAGSDEFERTIDRLRVLSAAQAAAMNDVRSTWQHHELPDNLPALVLWRESVMPADVRQQLNASLAKERSHWAQTHPCDRDRVAAAAALVAPGVFRLEDPAATLFKDFDALCIAVTKHFYEHDQRLPLDRVKLRTAQEMHADRHAADDASERLREFFGENFALNRVKPLPNTTAQAWLPMFNVMQAGAVSYAVLLKQHSERSETVFMQSVGSDLVHADFSLSSPQEFRLPSGDRMNVQDALAQSGVERKTLESAMDVFESAAAQRLAAALTWFDSQLTTTSDERARRITLINAQRALASVLKEFTTIRQARSSLRLMLNNASVHSEGVTLQRKTNEITIRCELALNCVLQSLRDLPHPYLPAGTSIRTSVRSPEAGDDEIVRALKAASICDDALAPLLTRIMGELCGMALAAEQTLKLSPPIAAPIAISASGLINLQNLPPPTFG